MSPLTAVGLTALVIVQCVFADLPWSYENGPIGPNNWYKNYPDCGGKYQSGIDIVGGYESKGPRPSYYNYKDVPTTMTLKNDGHILLITSTHPSGKKPTLKMRTISGHRRTYELDNVHFHWGKTNSEGNEHTFKGKKFPMEMHAVHMRVKDGVTVSPPQVVTLAYNFEISSNDNPAIAKILLKIANVKNSGTTAVLTPFAWNELMTEFSSRFYIYKGSMCFPPCSEIVNFVVREQPLKISSAQMTKFRTLLNSDNKEMSGNWRDTQPKNNRNIYYIH